LNTRRNDALTAAVCGAEADVPAGSGKWYALAAGICVVAAGAVVLWACPWRHAPEAREPPPPAGPILFDDRTDEVKLKFVHDAGPLPHDGKYFMPQIMGSGAAVADFDGDGLLDVLLLTNSGPHSFCSNCLLRQLPDGTFEDISTGSGLAFPGYNMGVAVGDVNNDGLPDVLITQFGGLKLLLNRGHGKFEDVTRAAGLDSPLWGTSAAFFDYDRDGWLDLVVVNYLEFDPTRVCDRDGRAFDYCPPYVFEKQVAKLFHNLGRPPGGPVGAVQFQDVTLTSGLGKLPGTGLGVVALDFTGDGWPDILVANDAHANYLWVNQRNGTFKEEATLRGLAYDRLGQPRANMGIAVADTAGTGMFDVFVTHERNEYHTLWKQGPRGFFQDETTRAGITNAQWRGTGFGTVFADFDHDGFPDLAVVNGRVQHGKMVKEKQINPATFWDDYAERNQLFVNDGQGTFRDVSAANASFCGKPAVARGLAWGVFGKEGAVDLLVTTIAGTARWYRNVAEKKGHWLVVRAVDPALGGRDAYGAEVTVQAGTRMWLGFINPAGSYLCSNDPRAHFGLGAVSRVDAVHIHWPDGARETFTVDGVDQVHLLRKGAGKTVPAEGQQP
jgi:enediyne biosynthesis protein E4